MTGNTTDGPGSLGPESSTHFSSWIDSESGIESVRLESTLGPTVTFPTPYPAATTDGRFLWVLGDVTDETWTLAVIDFRTDTVSRVASIDRHGPLPAIERVTGRAHVATETSIDTYDPRASTGESGPDGGDGETGGSDGETDDPLEPVRSIDLSASEWALEEVVSGLTQSADGDRLGYLADGDESRRLATVYLPTGEVDVWHSDVSRSTVVQFSPTDPTLAFFARESPPRVGHSGFGFGPESADAWLAREGLGARPLRGQLPTHHRAYWWKPDGGGLWYVEPGEGVCALDLELGHRRTVWEVPAQTAHTTHDGKTVAATVRDGDRFRLQVRSRTGTAVDVVSSLRQNGTDTDARTGWQPNPAFVAGDSSLAYTTFAHGQPTVALTPISAIR